MPPVFDGPVGGHEGGSQLITSHDDFEEVFAGPGRKLFESHVVDDEQVGFEVFTEQTSVGDGFFVHEFAYEVEDGDVAYAVAALDGFVAKALSQVSFAGARRADHEQVGVLSDECAGGEFEDAAAVDVWVELPVEAVERFEVDEPGGFECASGFTVIPQGEFILDEQFEELFVAELCGLSFLQPDGEIIAYTGKPELFEVGIEVCVHWNSPLLLMMCSYSAVARMSGCSSMKVKLSCCCELLAMWRRRPFRLNS